MNNDTGDWLTLWEMLFGYPPKEEVARGLESYLDDEFPPSSGYSGKGWKNADLRDALRRYAEASRKEGKRPKPPTATEVKTAMIGLWHARKLARQANEPPPARCGLCKNDGLVMYCPKMERPYTIWRMMTSYQVTVPCRCGYGQKLPEKMYRLNDREWATLTAQRAVWEMEVPEDDNPGEENYPQFPSVKATVSAVVKAVVYKEPIVKTNRAYSEKVARREEPVPF